MSRKILSQGSAFFNLRRADQEQLTGRLRNEKIEENGFSAGLVVYIYSKTTCN
ncbi:MAG: hypothetical protein KAT86_07185 [Candidatus Latescibacteria bacterium]|nr:hypothetical protein [Candidatus Latescibacterota bacterium]